MKQSRGGTRIIGKPSKISSSDRPLVSIVTACLNSEKYLEQTIQSVLGQTYDNIEYIIIDGGSTDKTLDIIQKYEKYIEYWVSEPDKGPSDAANKGISFAQGKWVGYICSDDFYAKDAVKLVVEASKTDKKAQVFHGILKALNSRESVDLRNCREHKGRTGNSLKELRVSYPTCFVSRKIYAKLKFNANFKSFASDLDLIVRLYLDNTKFGYINEPLVYCRPGGISSSLPNRREAYRMLIFLDVLFLPLTTRAGMKKSLETGRLLPLPFFFLLFLSNTMRIFPILYSILETAVKISLVNINPKLTRCGIEKYRVRLNTLFFKLRYRLFKVFFYRYGK